MTDTSFKLKRVSLTESIWKIPYNFKIARIHVFAIIQSIYVSEFFSFADKESPDALNNISTSLELLDYLEENYLMLHNMILVQGLFRKCKTKRLDEICLDYAQSSKDKVFYFEEITKREGK